MSDNRKLDNEEIYKKTKLSRILWYAIMLFGLSTIILAVCSLVFEISPIYCIIAFILEAISTKWRSKIKEDLGK